MLTVHHLGVSQSERIVWLCEELGIDYVLKRYDRVPPGLRPAPPEYKALHPLGTAPIITDGDVVLPESGAIMEYIIGKYGAGRLAVGPDAPNFADYLFWFHFAGLRASRSVSLSKHPGLSEGHRSAAGLPARHGEGRPAADPTIELTASRLRCFRRRAL